MRSFLRNVFLNSMGGVLRPQSGIHILNAHFVTPQTPSENDWEIFESFLKFLSRRCKFITIQEAVRLIEYRKFPIKECLVAFTFDDGFEECHTTIAPLLEKYDCNAAFFINANYIESGKAYQQEFHNRINTYTKRPMSWQQVKDLHQRGHVIGSHTLDHVNMKTLNEEELDYQLMVNKTILEQKLDYSCSYFAWTYGQLQHFQEKALEQTLKYHQYIFSGTNYKQYFSYNGQVINRRHLEAYWPKNHINYFLSSKKTN